ncbi:Scr1 family TA system antitoxin-like transcriptional regulator [Streptomyces sp. NPDC059994]|uniref:Scr1 family TA system antitoxin-like transcriptional regulator n=1 Tax=Streptomyces sp. NPDC059994 TaxID=3347029 RepID=UPI0036AF1195
MTSTPDDPPVRQLVLGANLAHLRDRCKVSQVHAAAAARVGTAELTRWETGQAPPPGMGLQRLMRLYGQPPAVHDVLARWATASATDTTPHELLDVADRWEARLTATELHAVRVQAFSDYTVPTLVRSSAYADHLEAMRSGVPVRPRNEQRWHWPVVTAPHAWEHVDIVLDASVLTRALDFEPGNYAPLADQLKHLLKVAHSKFADIRILPTGTTCAVDGEDSDLLGLTLPAPQSSTLWVQTTGGSATYINGPRGRERQRAFDELSAQAHARPLSAVLLHQAATRTARLVGKQ